jgi:hypothetical protein
MAVKRKTAAMHFSPGSKPDGFGGTGSPNGDDFIVA